MNIKNLNKEKRASKEGFTSFFNSKGFYIILILSIIIIGGATIFITRQSLSSISENEDLMPGDFEDYLVDYEDDFAQDDLADTDYEGNETAENEGNEVDTSADDAADNASSINNETAEDQEDNQIIQEKETSGDMGASEDKEVSKDGESNYLQKPDSTVTTNNIAARDEKQASEKLPQAENAPAQPNTQADSVAVGSETQAVKIPDIKENDKEKEERQEDKEENNNRENNDKNQETNDGKKTSVNEGTEEGKADGEITEVNRESEEVDFIMPVYGSIIYDYSMDKLAYSVTLNDWRTHNGLDIAVARGTPVKAVADGVVIGVYEDPKMGFTVIIDHENGLKTVYSNLASGDIVVPNQIVTQGETIGSVGNTALYEIALEPHLHFEVLKDDEHVDPKLYLPSY